MAALTGMSSSNTATAAAASTLLECQGKMFNKRWGEITAANEETEERKQMLTELWDDLVRWASKDRVEDAFSLCTCRIFFLSWFFLPFE